MSNLTEIRKIITVFRKKSSIVQKARAKLQQARADLGAVPVLVTNDEGERKANKLRETSFEELEPSLTILHWTDIQEMYRSSGPFTEFIGNIGLEIIVVFRSTCRKAA